MKFPSKKQKDLKKGDDDSLFGLLSPYKGYNTYFKILVSEKEDTVAVQITDNPGNWMRITDEKYSGYRSLKRLETGVTKYLVKYLAPSHLIRFFGSMLGAKLPPKKVTIINNIDKDGYFILETTLQYLPDIIQSVKRIINLPPQKKYEILEKCLSENVAG